MHGRYVCGTHHPCLTCHCIPKWPVDSMEWDFSVSTGYWLFPLFYSFIFYCIYICLSSYKPIMSLNEIQSPFKINHIPIRTKVKQYACQDIRILGHLKSKNLDDLIGSLYPWDYYNSCMLRYGQKWYEENKWFQMILYI